MPSRMKSLPFALIALVAGNRVAFSAPPANALTGLWVSEQRMGPEIRGTLAVTRRGNAWFARIAGDEQPVRSIGDSLQFDLAGKRGSFRGRLSAGEKEIRGFWIQPPGDPIGAEQPFATLTTLRRTSAGTWQGTVTPLDETFTLYLKIDRDSTGALNGVFRNPEYNSRGRAPQFRVSREGDSLRFVARPDTTRPAIRIDAVVNGDRMRVYWPELKRIVELERRDPARAPAFFPRPPGQTTYVYSQPPVTGDGWTTARAREVGMDEAMLTRLVQRLCLADPAARRPALIHSLLIAHRGKLVLEEYFFGFDRDRPHDLRSAGKTFASVILGAAMMRGDSISPQTLVYPLFDDRGPFAHPDPRKSRITLAHLLTHTSGLACDDNNDDSPGHEYTMQVQKEQRDWARYTLDLPMAYDPGSRYAYCSGGINLAGAVLAKATRTWLPELFEETIARPLQFGRYSYNLMPTHEGYLGGGTYVRPRDLLKLGQVYLDGGVWQGRRIVDSSWVTVSTSGQVEVSPATTGLDSSQFRQFYNEGRDAYAWHPGTIRTGNRMIREYEANGNGGQILMVMPDLDLTVVFTAGNYGQGIWWLLRDQITAQEIIPAVER